ncbi:MULTISPECIES: SDR family NAD(P)-dependent oxidoreductase [unclassified Streptomyces]|uniref:SDR family NAD(P)-dependent oxidoreductase n=1 Tax=unclassified Streptomyces TaxID=2593676 RepID=UPI00382713D2
MTTHTDTTTGTTTDSTAPARIAIVTGANRGLGRATALRLAADGVDPIITFRSHEDEAAAVVAEARALGRTAYALRLDTARTAGFADFADEVRRLLKEGWGRSDFDYLVNNAGSAVTEPFLEATEEGFDTMLNVHFKGVYFLTQRLVPLLADGGRIVNLSTGLTRFTSEGLSAYASMKGAVEVFTRYLAKELGPRGITVNAVAPGPTGTDFGGGFMRDDEGVRAALSGQAALGRVGTAEDIGGVIAAVLSDGTGWITGQRIEASGGFLL